MISGAAKAVAHALERHEWLKKLDRHDPVPQTAETDALYARVERRLGALQFKYTTCQSPPGDASAPADAVGAVFRGVALETSFGPSVEAQLTCLLEALSDYSSDPRPLAHAAPSEERAGLVRELFTCCMQLVSPHLASLTSHEEAKLALADATSAHEKAAGEAEAAAAKAAEAAEAKAKAAEAAAKAASRRDHVRVRLKRQYKLYEIPEAVNAGRLRLAAGGEGADGSRGSVEGGSNDCVWPTYGLLLFPGHASPQLPLEPPSEWSEEWSSSQQRKYWYNKRTKQSIWDSLRKTRPISFRSCAAAMMRWDRRMADLPEEKLLELADDIPPPMDESA